MGPEQNARSSKSGALRAAIFGMNDGLVSNLSLIFGVAGSGVAGKVVVIAGFAGLLAGAFSMAAGEYVSMKVQREVFEQLIHKEAHEIATQPEEEQRELARMYEKKGIDPETAEQISVALMRIRRSPCRPTLGRSSGSTWKRDSARRGPPRGPRS